ncbi:hypothetical protein PGT21_001132 [Puccinia graminis f. sp. tritici]|uniref:25S rRNA adenine-N(1) methyltransferase n=1 Tax=Puccinia graminis f. sp. tritici TaxID=56615 RepID=A0A5B0Q1M4_PUCGR|nr:hypothetical protein PGT21_001132 [Puccinia graminis f. sp. tritici]KAA1127926.1 hypothetical protein PGTUg99_012611 [Puccinia graminis f. sp. tritici]
MVQLNNRRARGRPNRNSLKAEILSKVKLTRSKQSTANSTTRNPSEHQPNSQSNSEIQTLHPTQESSASSSSSSSLIEDVPAELKRKTDQSKVSSDATDKKAKPSKQKSNESNDRGKRKDSVAVVVEGDDDDEDGDQEEENKKKIERLIRKHSKKIKDEPSKLISEFHRIEKRLSQPKLDPLTRHKLILEQKKLGGLEAYQTASKIGGALENGGETGKWCAQTLIELGFRPSGPPPTINKVTLLDVGAIDGKSYAKYTDWISTTSIDINPIDESVVARCDFFKFPLPKTEEQKFDVVGLSLVLNFIGDLKKRGEMIKRARKFLKPAGKLFIVLPLACLNNSRYLDFKRFRMILNYLGFKVIKQHNSSKLTYWLLEKEDLQSNTIDHPTGSDPTTNSNHSKSSLKFPKVQIRPGLSRNNFCIKV